MRKMLNLQECIIRLATEADTDDLLAIARGIWGGSDYLPKILPRWLSEPYFFVCEYHGRAIACIKLSLFPDHVLWFEGLRVLHRYQGKGVGSLMNREMFRFASQLKAKDPLLQFEFCTYYQNVESLHLTEKLGFRKVQGFYALDKHGIKRQAQPKIIEDYDMALFTDFPNYIPCGWQTVHNHPDSLSFIKERITVFETDQARYYVGGLTEKSIALLSPPPKDIKAELPFFQSFFPPLKRYGIIVPTGYKRYLGKLHNAGFKFWDNESKPVENMLVLRKD
jgi:GNAT superfamily N-acetyltransferase